MATPATPDRGNTSGDESLVADLDEVLDVADPPPTGLVDRVRAALDKQCGQRPGGGR